MCEYCEENKIIFEGSFLKTSRFCDEVDYDVIQKGFFIDRGHLRFCDLDDCYCLDNSEKVKINFCPFCGGKINQDWPWTGGE